jgi:hypothetical protein
MNVKDKVGIAVVGLHRGIYRLSGGRILGGFGL